jgi:PleD family two-component response regulator
VVLLNDTTTQGAITVGEQLRASIENLSIPHVHSSHQQVTISIGVATSRFDLPEPPVKTAKARLKMADNALL